MPRRSRSSGSSVAVKQADMTEDAAQGAIYYPLAHHLDSELYVVLRTNVPRRKRSRRRCNRWCGASIRDLPVSDIQSMDTRISRESVARRSPALLAVIFSGLAVLLTAIGTYGVLSYAVSQRRREIGLRMALGAAPRPGAPAVSVGRFAAACGRVPFSASLARGPPATRSRALLFRVPAVHAATLAGTLRVMTTVSLAACLLPAHRAARISPMEALAEE